MSYLKEKCVFGYIYTVNISVAIVCILLQMIKQPHYSPGQAQSLLRKLRFPDFVTTAQDGGKVVSLMHRPSLPPGNVPGTHFC